MSSPRSGPALLDRIVPGLTGTAEIVVGPEHTAPFVGSGRIAVLATPVMINLIEAAATPVGLRVTASAEVSQVQGRTITFRVAAHDEFEPIGGGTHRRVVVSVSRFDERVQRKLAQKNSGKG